MREFDNFTAVKDCWFKGEHYSVRNNGAVYRHPKNPTRPRPSDKKWTFGTENEKEDCFCMGTHKVHLIVAKAFFNYNPSPEWVVDHKDGDKYNNRVDNLQIICKLQNALNSPLIRKKVRERCGSIENLLNDPYKYREMFIMEPYLSWIVPAAINDAEACRDQLERWNKEDAF